MTQCEQRDSSLMASFESENRTFTFGQMHETATKIAAGLLALDVKPGERVAIWGPNQPEWLIMVS
jgi:long-subunit acyl-CoA synthetase (AMP-forming)